MQRLRGGDAQFLYNETSSSPFVTLKVMIYEPVDVAVQPSIDEIKTFIAEGVADWIYKGLGLRVVRVPFDLHHPLWVEDRNFRLDNHIHHIALPAPGDKDMLCRFISKLMSTPLDPNRPLWDSWLVEGLAGGRIAWVCKMHHVLADGLMSAEHIVNIHAPSNHQTSTSAISVSDFIFKDYPKIPSRGRLFWDAFIDLLKTYSYEFPKYRREYKAAKAANLAQAPAPSAAKAYGPFMAPFTMLNKLGGGHYLNYRYESFPLAEFKALAKRLGCTINNLVLGICSEALRRYLREHDGLPEQPLVIIMPVSNRRDGGGSFLNSEFQNNSVSLAYVPLDLSISDFYQRLDAIKAGSAAAMQQLEYTSGTRMENFADFMPGSFFRLLNWVMLKRQQRRQNPLSNMSISNVPGPRQELYACDGKLRMTELLSCGNLGDSTSLGVTVWSYVDNLCFSCFFRDGVMPEPASFTEHLHTIYQALKADQIP